MVALTVTHAFGSYSEGDRITDPAAVKEIQAGNVRHFVVRTALTEAETEALAKAKADRAEARAAERAAAETVAVATEPAADPAKTTPQKRA